MHDIRTKCIWKDTSIKKSKHSIIFGVLYIIGPIGDQYNDIESGSVKFIKDIKRSTKT